MKFNPNGFSVVVALNLPSESADLALINLFYKGEVAKLNGYWEGESERSYQLSVDCLDIPKMRAALAVCNQEAFLYIATTGRTYLSYLDNVKLDEYIGTMSKSTKDSCCTYCRKSKTYWKAVL